MLDRLDYLFSGVMSVVGSVLAYTFGDINTVMICLFGFLALDYITGVLVAIGNHELSSAVGFKGLCKKVFILALVGVGHLLDKTLGTEGDIIRSLVCCFYIANEGISIIENAGNLGLPVPKKLLDILLSVKRKNNDEEVAENE